MNWGDLQLMLIGMGIYAMIEILAAAVKKWQLDHLKCAWCPKPATHQISFERSRFGSCAQHWENATEAVIQKAWMEDPQ